MDSANKKIVSDFIECIKQQTKAKLASNINFPFKRMYPIPDIDNEEEFVNRYSEIFDDSLSKIVANSQPLKDWSTVGWRGMILLRGVVWLDYDGRLAGVNYQSKIEQQKWKQLVEIDKMGLYKSLRNFKQPICIIEIPKYRVRIDALGEWSYRYASWPLKSKMSDRPDLIIERGKYMPEGNGGNGRYEFKTGEYTYECSMIVIGEDSSPPAILKFIRAIVEYLFRMQL